VDKWGGEVQKNFKMSQELTNLFQPSRGACFLTAARIAKTIGGWYVEGVLEDGTTHGWNEIDGMIVDAQLPGYAGVYRRIRRWRGTTMSKYKGWLPRAVNP
jgi:hypothetical protein